MWIKFKKNKSGSKTVQLVETIRVLGKKQPIPRVVKIFGTAKADEELLCLKNDAQKYLDNLPKVQYEKSTAGSLVIKDGTDIESCTTTNIGFNAIFGNLYNRIFSELDLKANCKQIVKNLAIMRIANPKSKRHTSNQAKDYNLELNLHNVYKSMDKIDDNIIKQIQNLAYKNTKSLLNLGRNENLDLLFYDLTTIYFETNCQDALREFGFSKDGKHQHVQIMLALIVTKHGLPVGYELFNGSMYEGHTLIPTLKSLKERYQIDRITVVADSGLISEYNIEQIKECGFDYIIGGRIKNSSQETKEQILDLTQYQELNDDLRYTTYDNCHSVKSYKYRIINTNLPETNSGLELTQIDTNTNQSTDAKLDLIAKIAIAQSKLKSEQIGFIMHHSDDTDTILAVLKNGAVLEIANDQANTAIYTILSNACINHKKLSAAAIKLLSNNETLNRFIQTDKANKHDKIFVYHSQTRAKKDAYERCKNLEKIKNHVNQNLKNKLTGCLKKPYVKLTNATSIEIDYDKLAETAKLDGYFSLQTNITDLSAKDIIDNYRGLWQIEQTFRLSKYNLKLRPIFHYSLRRIKAHFTICYIALVIIRTLEYLTKSNNCYIPIEQLCSLLEQVMVTNIISKGNAYNISNNFPDELIPIYKCTNTKIPTRFSCLNK